MFFVSLGNCRESRVEGYKSRVVSRGSRVASRRSQVDGRKSRVSSRGSHVEGRMSRVEDHRSRVRVESTGSKSKCLYVFYHSKERSIFIGTCWLNTKSIVKRLSLATPGKKCDIRLNKNTSFFRTVRNMHTDTKILTLYFWLSISTFSPSTYDSRPSTCDPRLATTDLHYLPGLSAWGQKVSALVLTYYRSSRQCKLPHTNFCCLWANYVFRFVKKVLYLYFG